MHSERTGERKCPKYEAQKDLQIDSGFKSKSEKHLMSPSDEIEGSLKPLNSIAKL